MTEDQIKKIAEITLLNTSAICRLCDAYAVLAEKLLPLLPEEGRIALLSELEQFQAVANHLQGSLEASRKEIGLDSTS